MGSDRHFAHTPPLGESSTAQAGLHSGTLNLSPNTTNLVYAKGVLSNTYGGGAIYVTCLLFDNSSMIDSAVVTVPAARGKTRGPATFAMMASLPGGPAGDRFTSTAAGPPGIRYRRA